MKDKDTIISVEGVNKQFNLQANTVYALKDIFLDVFQGEYLSVMGPSGSGKSTLFNMIGALDKPTSGAVSIKDVSLTSLTSSQLSYFRNNYIGYVFQTFNLLPAMSALHNVSLPILLTGVSQKEAENRAKEVLDQVGLGDRTHHRPDELSGGQQQRVAIARALANEPMIILADEPTANLDLKTGEQIIEILSSLSREKGVTIVTATHDHKMLASSDRVVWISDGKIARVEKREDLNIKIGSIDGEE
ncbi:MAG: ABC transporter ATP-binding protein [Kiritimatiellae bacterium]|jgi:putative ABC transport system ATP-binding protein|nr:ABC transporter ATP-binding protein [Kiritimatiellia bacterium]